MDGDLAGDVPTDTDIDLEAYEESVHMDEDHFNALEQIWILYHDTEWNQVASTSTLEGDTATFYGPTSGPII
jgi:hypothetical protein